MSIRIPSSEGPSLPAPAPGRPIRAVLAGVGLVLLVFCVALAVAGGAAQAQERPLDAPRAEGIVGERYDGYAVLRDTGASADIHNLVAQTNAKRQEVYRERAASEGVSVEEVGKVYAQKIFNAAPAGTWFLLETGEWVQK